MEEIQYSEEDRKDPVRVFKKFRESLGNDISFHTTRSTLYRNFQQGTNETIHELDIRLSKVINKCAFKVDIIKECITLDILVYTCQYYEVKKWCNTQPNNGNNKLTYEAVLRKAKEHEAEVTEYIHLVEENPTMTTAFQQTKQVAVDALKIMK